MQRFRNTQKHRYDNAKQKQKNDAVDDDDNKRHIYINFATHLNIITNKNRLIKLLCSSNHKQNI